MQRGEEAPVNADPLLSDALAFWNASRSDGTLPTRTEIDPLRIPRHLSPYLILADVLSPDGRMRFRLVGSAMRERWGEDFQHKTSREIFTGTYRTYIEGAFALCIAERLPVYTESHFRWDVDGYLWTRRLMLPIGENPNSETVQVLVVQTWPGSDGETLVHPMVVLPKNTTSSNSEPAVVR